MNPTSKPSPFPLNRRDFVGSALAAIPAFLVSGCKPVTDPGRCDSSPSVPLAKLSAPSPAATPPLAKLGSREETLKLVDGQASYYMGLCHNCAQSSFLALHEVFSVGDVSLAKALTPLPGIAERGETCGAVTGCLLALGFVYGRERLDDWAGWRACLIPARRFCSEFEMQMGSTQCGDIVEKLFGRRYNLADPAELGEFQKAGPTEKCGRVVRTAVKIAAQLILEK